MEEREMTAREYLDQIRVLDAKIQNLIQEKETFAKGALFGGVSYRERVQSSPDPDPCASWYCTLETKEEEINREIDALYSLMTEVTRAINELQDARYIRVLYARHVELKKLRVIADEMGYAYQYTRTLHGEALKEFEKRYYKIIHNHTSKCDII